MTTGNHHERVTAALGYLILALAEGFGFEALSSRSTTWMREDLECSVEADDCFHIQNEARVRDPPLANLRESRSTRDRT